MMSQIRGTALRCVRIVPGPVRQWNPGTTAFVRGAPSPCVAPMEQPSKQKELSCVGGLNIVNGHTEKPTSSVENPAFVHCSFSLWFVLNPRRARVKRSRVCSASLPSSTTEPPRPLSSRRAELRAQARPALHASRVASRAAAPRRRSPD